MNNRYEELDSLRGIASLIVLFYHMAMIIPKEDSPFWNILNNTPFRIFIAGTESVIFFFILSGFVLSLQFLRKNGNVNYSIFIVKRICRIYIPYLIALSIAIIMKVLFSREGIEGLSSWFNMQWVSDFNWNLIINHYILLGNFNIYAYNVVLWSLIHEMRISIIFPIIMFLVIKYNYKINIAIGMLLALMGGLLHLVYQEPYQALYKSLPYILMFILGALIAKNLSSIKVRYRQLTKNRKIILFLAGILIYTYSYMFKNPILIDWVTSLGALIIMITALLSFKFSQFLLHPILNFLGKISYSLYLYHMVVLLTFINIFYEILTMLEIFLLSLVTMLFVSWLSWIFIEKRSISFWKKVSSRLKINISESRKPLEREINN